MNLSFWLDRYPLKQPYHLSFATLKAFDTAFIKIDGAGRSGFGEVTPLPGYSDETIESVQATLDATVDSLGCGVPIQAIVDELSGSAPMVASALTCALETWEEGVETAFAAPLDGVIPVAALCVGKSPEQAVQSAQRLTDNGFQTLKLKIGVDNLAADIARVRAVSAAISGGVSLRLDANQALTFEAAMSLSDAVAGSPVAYIEQPFAPDEWDLHARFAAQSPLPLMLDESIWTRLDVERAAHSAHLVKLKLCKHTGMAETMFLARLARQLGLGVVFGNGVQTGLGNHLEARLYRRMGLDGAAEISGFEKLSEPPAECRMKLGDGVLYDHGIGDVENAFRAPKASKTVAFNF